MALLAFEFFFRLLWGWNFYLIFISRAESSEAFLKVSARFSLGYLLTLVAAAYMGGLELNNMSLFVSLLIFLASVAYLSKKYLFLRALSVGIILFSPLLLFQERSFMFFMNFVLSSLALGGAFVGQFLGHWYLNVPNIHIREFKRISNFSFMALVVRLVWVLGVVFLFPLAPIGLVSGEFFDLRGDAWLGLGSFGLILLGSRILWGLAAPLVMSWMAKQTVDMRSTQSATGIFYANSVLMLIGELCALYLEKELQWPI